MRKFTLQEISEYLEISLPQLRGSFEQQCQQFEEFKIFVKQRRRELAKKYHPDKNPEHTDRMKTINAVVDFVQLLKLTPPKPKPVMKVYHYVYRVNTGSIFDSSTSGTDFNIRFF